MESVKANEEELTSTMGNLLSTSKDDKNDASDSTPTSSTDAFTTTSTSLIAADDPISSTSSDVLDAKKSTEKVKDVAQSSSVMSNNMSLLKDMSGDHSSSPIVSEKDLLDMNITDTSTEKITENVDDIVQDLENLLGEPTTSFDFSIRSKDSKSDNTSGQNKDITVDFDVFSAELQMLSEPSVELKKVSKDTIKPNNVTEAVNSPKNKDLNAEQISINNTEKMDDSQKIKEIESSPTIDQKSELSSNSSNIKTTEEPVPDEKSNNSQNEITSEVEQVPEKREEMQNITTTLPKTKENKSVCPPSHEENKPVAETDVEMSTNEKTIQEEKMEDEGLTKNKQDCEEQKEINSDDQKVKENLEKKSGGITNNTDISCKEEAQEVAIEKTEEPEQVDLVVKETTEVSEEDNFETTTKQQHNEESSMSTDEVDRVQEQEVSVEKPTIISERKVVGSQTSEDDGVKNQEEEPPVNENEKLPKVETFGNVEGEVPVRIEEKTPASIIEPTSTNIDEETSTVVEITPVVVEESPIDAPPVSEDQSEKVPDQEEKMEVTITEEPVKEKLETFLEESVAVPEVVEEAQNTSFSVLEDANTEEFADSCVVNETVCDEPETEKHLTEVSTELKKETEMEVQQEIEERIEEISEHKHDNITNVEETQVEATVEETKVEATVEKTQVEASVEDTQVAAVVKETQVEATIEDTQVAAVVEDLQVEATVEDTKVAAVVEEPQVAGTIEDTQTEAAVEDMQVEIAVEKTQVVATIDATQVEVMVEEQKVKPPFEHLQLQPVPSEISDIVATKSPKENIELLPSEERNVAEAAPVEFIPDNIELPIRSLAEDLDLLVQNAVGSPVETITQEEKPEDIAEVPTSSVDDLKNLPVMENNILPLAMEDVPDLEVLNAISTLSDNKQNLIPEMIENVQESDALLTSSSLEQPSDVQFETESVLPTVEEIFAEQNQPEEVDLQDDNLETLLAVASLQSVDYTLPPVEVFTPPIEQNSNYVPQEPRLVPELPTFEPVEPASKIQEPVEAKVPEVVRAYQEVQKEENKLNEPLVINIDDTEKDRVYSPKITIKPIKPPEEEETVSSGSGDVESTKGSLKMTITKQSDNMHSILKIYDPSDDQNDEPTIPKLIIKPIVQPNDQSQSPKMSTRSSKVFSPSSSSNQRSASPRITIKPIPKPEEAVAPLKITIKPVLKADDSHKQKHSPKLTIKPVLKPEEESSPEAKVHSPRVTIKPIVKPPEEIEQVSSPRITIKPIVKPVETEPVTTTPRVTIKPVVKPDKEVSEQVERSSPKITIKPIVKHPETECPTLEPTEKSSPKITIKPIIKPQEPENVPYEDYEESIKERIVLKINKGVLPGSSKDCRKRDEEKLTKIKLKFSKEGGHPQIVQDETPPKRVSEHFDHDKIKRQRMDTEFLPGVTITPIGPTQSKLKEMLSRNDTSSDKIVTIDDDDDDVSIVEEHAKASPIVISEESNQDSMAAAVDFRDPISEIPVFEITPESVKRTLNPQPMVEVATPVPRKRGRPRKVPLQVREDFKDPKEEEPKPVVVESTRPKRSCRGQSVRTTLGIKPRKPRGPGRGRGSKRGMGSRSTPTPPATPPRAAKEPKLGGTKLKELKEDSFLLSDKSEVKTLEIDDGFRKSPSNSLLAPPQSDTSTADRADIVMYEEETRMSAETSSRAQTPAKQVVTTVDLVEESQSSIQSIQSTATTESVKVRKGPRLEVHQEPEGAVISADQLAEYYWSGGGPFMLQEQVAQFLGIKSFKRKYPNIQRRVVDMQERDFIRESGLAGEAMCDLGLTAVNSSDILDIMYSDFQDKYEEYCKHQRDRQAKDLINKQKALSLAASQEKAKMDITQQAVQSAASWNATFNKSRRDQRKSCMDLQTLTIHFPKGKMKQINKPKIGYYPVALVPGQFTDYYREFTPTEINNLPLNTLCYNPVIRGVHHEMECDSQTDGSGSESDTSSSDSDSSYSGSSDGEDCTLCKPTPKRVAAAQ